MHITGTSRKLFCSGRDISRFGQTILTQIRKGPALKGQRPTGGLGPFGPLFREIDANTRNAAHHLRGKTQLGIYGIPLQG